MSPRPVRKRQEVPFLSKAGGDLAPRGATTVGNVLGYRGSPNHVVGIGSVIEESKSNMNLLNGGSTIHLRRNANIFFLKGLYTLGELNHPGEEDLWYFLQS